MLLLQLLRLLLVPLLHLLLSALVSLLLFHTLMFLILLLLKFLPLLFLLREKLLLLLLVFPVLLGIAGLRRSGTLKWWKIFGMDRVGRSVPTTRLCGSTISRRIIRRTCLLCRNNGAVVKCSRFRSSGNRRLATVGRRMQLRVGPRGLKVLALSGYTVAAQSQHFQSARSDPELHASANRGKPPIAATPKPAAFHDRSVVPAKEAGAPYNPPANRRAAQPGGGNAPSNAVHPKDLPPFQRPAAPQTGDAKQDRKYQQQQEKLFAQQEKERQKLQQKQDQEHQRMEKQQADQGRKQQVEQRHQQQTQQLQQKHVQDQQRMQEKQQPPKR